MTVAALSARTLARYAVPIAVITAVAFAPLLLVAFGVRPPAHAGQAKVVVRTTYALAGASVGVLLLLVAGIAPLVRAIATRTPRSQWGALRAGLAGLAHGVVPCGLAVLVVALGGLALVVPGALLLVLVSLTGASTHAGAQARIVDSVTLVRPRLVHVALVLGVSLAIYALAIALHHRGLVPVPKKPPPAQLAAYRAHLHVIVLAAAIAAPLLATLLAAIHTRATASVGSTG